MKIEVRDAAVVTVAMVLAGVLLGVLWWWLAPHVPLIADDSAVYLKDTEGEQAIGVDGTFTLLALAFGAVSAVVVFLVRRRGVCRSLSRWRWRSARVAARLAGRDLARADAERGRPCQASGQGVTFSAPLKLGAKGRCWRGPWRGWWFISA